MSVLPPIPKKKKERKKEEEEERKKKNNVVVFMYGVADLLNHGVHPRYTVL